MAGVGRAGRAGRADGGRGMAREDETMSNLGAETVPETLQGVGLGALGVGGTEGGGEWGRGVQRGIVTGICRGMKVGRGGTRAVSMRTIVMIVIGSRYFWKGTSGGCVFVCGGGLGFLMSQRSGAVAVLRSSARFLAGAGCESVL